MPEPTRFEPPFPTDEVRLFTRRLSERLRHLRSQQSTLPTVAHGFARSLVGTLEESVEELHVTAEELRVQNETLAEAMERLEAERTRFRRLFDAAPDPLMATDAFGTVREINRAAARMLGIARERLDRKPMATFLAPGSVGAFRAYVQRLGRFEGASGVELELRPQGGDAAVRVRARAVHVPESRDDGVQLVWTLTPLGPRGAEEHAWALEEALFLARAARALSGVRVDDVARAAARQAAGFLCDYALVDVVQPGKGLRRVAVAHREPEREEGLAPALRGVPQATTGGGAQEATEDEVAEGADDPAARTALLSVAEPGLPGDLLPERVQVLRLEGDAQPVGALTLVWTGHDRGAPVSAATLAAFARSAGAALALARRLEAAEAEARGAQESARGRMRAMGELSHEIRTPLHSIIGYCQLLLEGIPEPIPAASRRYVTSVVAGATHLSGLVEDVLSLHRQDQAQQPLELSDVSAAEVLAECAGMVRERAERAGLGLQVEVGDGVILHTDRSKLRQILINLLVNAIKFTREGSVTATVGLEGDRVVFSVRDTGCGIDGAERPHVFEPFWRGSAAGRSEGFGLGLSLVRTLAERLGGAVELDSVPGEGTTFRVLLPRHGPDS